MSRKRPFLSRCHVRRSDVLLWTSDTVSRFVLWKCTNKYNKPIEWLHPDFPVVHSHQFWVITTTSFTKWTGNKSYIPCHGPAINHAYRVVTKSLHATLKNGSHFARGNSCVLRLAFSLRWGQRYLFSQLIRHKRVLNVFNMTNDTNYRMVTFSHEKKFKAVSPSALCN